MSEKYPQPPTGNLTARLDELRAQQEKTAKYRVRFSTAAHPFPDEGSGIEDDIVRDSQNISLVYGNEVGPLIWVRERRFYPSGNGFAEPSRLLLGMMVIDERADPGNRVRVAVYRPGAKRTIHSVTDAALQRDLNLLLPYPAQGSDLGDERQMRLYPNFQELPEEIDFMATAMGMVNQMAQGSSELPELISPVSKPVPQISSQSLPEHKVGWRTWAAGIGMAGLATYALVRRLQRRETTSK